MFLSNNNQSLEMTIQNTCDIVHAHAHLTLRRRLVAVPGVAIPPLSSSSSPQPSSRSSEDALPPSPGLRVNSIQFHLNRLFIIVLIVKCDTLYVIFSYSVENPVQNPAEKSVEIQFK